MRIQSDYSLLNHNTFGLNVKAKLFVEYYSKEELSEFVQTDLFKSYKFLHIGSGSNLLFLSDFQGLILHSGIKTREVIRQTEDNVFVSVGSGVVWDDFVAYCVANDWYGAENLSLIPGEVGASAVQNIGAYGVEVKDLIHSLTALELSTGKFVTFSNEDCKYDYRQSVFKNEYKYKYVITEVVFKLSLKPVFVLEYGHLKAEFEDQPTLKSVRDKIIEIRTSKLPDHKEFGNAGSFFMNPVVPTEKAELLKVNYPSMPSYKIDEKNVKIPAGWLIEQSGWKGKSMGNAGVYKLQALVLVNLGGATGNDILRLASQIINDVNTKFDIILIPEVNYII